MKRFLTIVFAALVFALPAKAQEVVTELSEYEIELTPSFSGQELFLFGAIKDGGNLDAERLDVVVVIQGESRPHMVHKKKRIVGFWINSESIEFEGVPAFYGQASTRPLDTIADSETLQALGLGIAEQPFYKGANGDDASLGFAEGLVREKMAAGLYQISEGSIPIMSDVLFRADFFFPAIVPSGTYDASVYLFHDGQLIGQSSKAIRVDQVGVARALNNLAHEHSALYGIMAILIALMAGWLAGYITQGRGKYR